MYSKRMEVGNGRDRHSAWNTPHGLDQGLSVVSLDVKLRSDDYDVLVVAPPCNTHSRALFSGRPGPRPVRDVNSPRGFVWLKARAKKKAKEANLRLDRSVESCQVAAGAGVTFCQSSQKI